MCDAVYEKWDTRYALRIFCLLLPPLYPLGQEDNTLLLENVNFKAAHHPDFECLCGAVIDYLRRECVDTVLRVYWLCSVQTAWIVLFLYIFSQHIPGEVSYPLRVYLFSWGKRSDM